MASLKDAKLFIKTFF